MTPIPIRTSCDGLLKHIANLARATKMKLALLSSLDAHLGRRTTKRADHYLSSIGRLSMEVEIFSLSFFQSALIQLADTISCF